MAERTVTGRGAGFRPFTTCRSAPRARADGLMLNQLIELFEPYDPLLRAGSWIHTQLGDRIDYGYLARRLVRMGQVPRVTSLAEVIPDFSRQFEVYGLLFQVNGQADQAREAFTNALRANPLNMQARYTIAKDYLGLLSRGEAPEDIQEIADDLSGPAAAVIQGWGYGAAADWPSLAAIDAELGRSRITDAWYPEVARLRAEWRVNVAENQQRFAFDALRFIERVLILAPDQNLYLLRAMCARILGDDDRLVESSRYIASYVRSNLNASASPGNALSDRDLEQMRQNLTAIINQLSGAMDVADPDRVTGILNDTNALLQYIDDYQQAQ